MTTPQLPKVLDSNMQEAGRLHPISVSIDENIIPLSTASIRLLEEEIIPERTYVELFTVNGSAGVYRTRAPRTDYHTGTGSINLEHAICEIGDFIVHEEIAQTEMTLANAVQRVFGHYGGSKWQIGTVAPNVRVVLSANHSNILQTINTLIAQVPGAMLTYDFSTTPWTFNIVYRDTTVSSEGRLSRNVTAASVQRDDSTLFTRVWLNGLQNAYLDADTISRYGIIETNLPDRGYTQSQAQIVASAYLEKHKNPRYSIKIDALAFSSITGEPLDSIAIGKLYRLAIPHENVVIEETVVSISWRNIYGSSYDVQISLSEDDDTIINFVQSQNSASYGAGGQEEYIKTVKDSLSHSIVVNDENIQIIYSKTGVNSLGNEETLYSKITQNATSIASEIERATAAENGKIAKTSVLQTAEQIVTEAVSQSRTEAGNTYIAKTSTLQTATQIVNEAVSQSATAAGNTYIAKTQTLQTADQIVTEAVSQSRTEAGNTYIAKTSTLQTATQIVNEAVSQSATAAGNTYIAKTQTLQTADQIVTEAVSQSASAASNNYIAKTSTLQTATQIVNEAVSQSATAAGNAYIAKTSTYQTADSIVSEAHRYSDGNYNTLDSRIDQQADRISLVVSGSGAQAAIDIQAITDAINSSAVTISANKINLRGNVSIEDLSEYNSTLGRLEAGDMYANTLSLGVWEVGAPNTNAICADYAAFGTLHSTNVTITNALTTKGLSVTDNFTLYNMAVSVYPITINGSTIYVLTVPGNQGGV